MPKESKKSRKQAKKMENALKGEVKNVVKMKPTQPRTTVHQQQQVAKNFPRLTGFAASVALPGLVPTQRCPGHVPSAPTAVAEPFYHLPYIPNAPYTPPPDLGHFGPKLGSPVFGVTRSIYSAIIQTVENYHGKPSYLNLWFYGKPSITADSDQTALAQEQAFSVSTGVSRVCPLNVVFARDPNPYAENNFHPYVDGGKVFDLFAISHAGRKGIWINAESAPLCQVQVRVDGKDDLGMTASAVMYELTGDSWTSSDEKPIGSPLALNGTGGVAYGDACYFTVKRDGFYGFDVNVTVSTVVPPGAPSDGEISFSTAITFTTTGVSTFTGTTTVFKPIPDLEYMITSGSSARMLGASVLVTNATAEAYASGMATGYQVTANELFGDLIVADTYESLLNRQRTAMGERRFPLKTGIYGFHKPVDESSFEMIPFAFRKDGGVSSFNNPYRSIMSPMLLALSFNPAVPSGTAPPSFDVVYNFSVEYTTQNMWIETVFSKSDRGAFSRSLDRLTDLDQFYENPTHFGDILRGIISRARDWGSKAIAIAPALMSAISPVVPAVGAGSKAYALASFLKGMV